MRGRKRQKKKNNRTVTKKWNRAMAHQILDDLKRFDRIVRGDGEHNRFFIDWL